MFLNNLNLIWFGYISNTPHFFQFLFKLENKKPLKPNALVKKKMVYHNEKCVNYLKEFTRFSKLEFTGSKVLDAGWKVTLKYIYTMKIFKQCHIIPLTGQFTWIQWLRSYLFMINREICSYTTIFNSILNSKFALNTNLMNKLFTWQSVWPM